ncbi:MAG: hypothetical protein Q9212_006967 [Teloschistes hypoglaucus]
MPLKDASKHVAVVEAQSVLGGHTNISINTTTGTPIDYELYLNRQRLFREVKHPLIAFKDNAGAAPSQSGLDFLTRKQAAGYVLTGHPNSALTLHSWPGLGFAGFCTSNSKIYTKASAEPGRARQ